MRWLVVALLAWSTSAHAQTPAETRTERYGTTIAIADGISVAVLAGGIAVTARSDGGGTRAVGIIGIVIGAGGYIWASPIVHHMRGRRELSKIDIGMRIFIPGLAAGITAGVTACPNDDDACEANPTPILIAGGIGMVVASTIDIVWMAKQRVPYVAPTQTGVVLGVAGAF